MEAIPLAILPARRTKRPAKSPRPSHARSGNVHQQTPSLALPPEEAAHALHITRSAVYRLIAQAKQGDPDGLPSIKIGKRRLVPVIALEAFIQRRLETAS